MLPMARFLSKLWQRGRAPSCPTLRRMGFLLSLSLAALCLGIVLCAGRSAASSLQEDVCGPILADNTWTVDQSPIDVTCDTALRPGVTLTVEQGVEVRFTAGVSLTISGMLRAIGTPAHPITFTSGLEEPEPGDWNGLHFVAGSSDSRLAWFVVEYATNGVHIFAAWGETVGPELVDCAVRHNAQSGILLEGEARYCDEGLAQPTIVGCTVEHNGKCGIEGYGHGHSLDGCDPELAAGGVAGTVSGTEIRHNQGSGVCLKAEPLRLNHGDVWTTIEANIISDNDGHGVHLENRDDDPVRPRIQNNLIYGNTRAGIQSDAKHEETDLFVVNNTLFDNDGDGMVFNKSALQVVLANNIVLGSGGYGLVCNGADDPQAAHNALWLNAYGDYSGCAPGVSDISADPLLLDPAAGDFHLAFGSPCIDAGTSTGAPPADFEGIARPQGGGVDIGAYEQGYWRLHLPVILRE